MPFFWGQTKYRLSQVTPFMLMAILSLSGCFAPLHSPGIPAAELPDTFRYAVREYRPQLNLGSLVVPPPIEYLLGAGDVLEVIIPDLFGESIFRPIRVPVQKNGSIQLPRVGVISVGGDSLQTAQIKINRALANGILVNPTASVTLLEKGTVNVLVLGEVDTPGIHALTRYENDIAHAIAAAGGFTENAADAIELHRHQLTLSVESTKNSSISQSRQTDNNNNQLILPVGWEGNYGHSINAPMAAPQPQLPTQVVPPQLTPTPDAYQPGLPLGPSLRIPLRGHEIAHLGVQQVILNAGDVIVVPPAKQDVFYVVGKLSTENRTRFSLDNKNREIGNGFLLPKDRDIDVVTAVAMAGYIDPIDSPTTVTVHRIQPNGDPLLVRVDLIAARYNKQETILVQPGDIIYLNPDYKWWFRRTFDRILERSIGSAFGTAGGILLTR